MSKKEIKRLLILNLPYFILGLVATNFGEAWRLAEGADSSAKILSFFSAIQVALRNPLPTFYPLDIVIGVLCGAGLRLAVYLKGKMLKNTDTISNMDRLDGVQQKILPHLWQKSLRIM